MLNAKENSSQIIVIDNKDDLVIKQKENMNMIYPDTKFSIPRMQTKIAERELLLKELDKTFYKKVLIIHAPAGFGKTTMVSNWIYKKNYIDDVLWITLDKRDDSEYHFWHCIAYGLHNQMHSQFKDCLKLFNSYSRYPLESIVNLLVNSLAKVNKQILIILDDFHNIQNKDTLHSFRLFLNCIPQNTHILLLSRCKPNLSLSKLRMWDEILELSMEDFQFSIDEVEDFLNNKLNLGLNNYELKDLYNRTEGWITAIKLTAASLKKKANKNGIIQHLSDSYRWLEEFLFDEIISNFSLEVQEFIIKTSCLETLNAPLCNHVMKKSDSDQVFKYLMSSQMFIFSLDRSGNSYRYHSLFAHLLRDKLRLKYPGISEELYLRASKWCEENAYVHDAIRYSIRSGNQENSARLIEAFGEKILYGSDYFKFIEYIDALPSSILNNPLVLIRYAIALIYTKRIGKLKVTLKRKGISIDHEAFSEYRGELLGIKAVCYLYEGNFAEAEACSKKAIEAISAISKFRGYVYYSASYILVLCNQLSKANDYVDEAILFSEEQNDYNLLTMAICHKSLILYLNLKLSNSCELLKKTLDFISVDNEMTLPATTSIYLYLGSLYYEFDDLNNALHYIKKALENSIIRNDKSCIAQSYMYLSNIYCAKNEKRIAFEYLKLAVSFFNKDMLELCTYQQLISLVKVAIAIGDIDYAEEIIEQCYNLIPDHLKFFYYFALTELFIAQNKYIEAISIIEKIESIDFGEINGLFSIFMNNQYALSYYGLKSKKKSSYYIRKVLKASQDSGFIRTPISYGCAMYDLLSDFIKVEHRSKSTDISLLNYAKKLISHFDEANFKERKLQSTQGSLTPRETEILKYLASGATNQEIASDLFLSTNTVKKHVNNIFDKLKVKNRVQAAELFNQLEL
jgi:LuxR family maltose regulon positive regulatory protein